MRVFCKRPKGGARLLFQFIDRCRRIRPRPGQVHPILHVESPVIIYSRLRLMTLCVNQASKRTFRLSSNALVYLLRTCVSISVNLLRAYIYTRYKVGEQRYPQMRCSLGRFALHHRVLSTRAGAFLAPPTRRLD
jgi:hypothetical protein